MADEDVPRQAQTCKVCGGERYAAYCRQCQQYDVWINRYALTAWLGRTLLLTLLTGALGIGLNALWEQRQRSRDLILQQLAHAHEDAAALRMQIADLMGRRVVALNCPWSEVDRCFETAVTERNSMLQQTFTLSWAAPHAFGWERNDAAIVADNSWKIANALRGEVQQNDYEYSSCMFEDATHCEKVYAQERRLRSLQNYCLVTLGCMVAFREIELREDMIENGMHRQDRELAQILRGPVEENFCAGVLEQRKPVCTADYPSPEELVKAIEEAAALQ